MVFFYLKWEVRIVLEKHKAFCDYYLASGNGAQSAIKAGYSKKTANVIACQLLSREDVSSYLKKKHDKKHNSRILTAIERQEFLSDLIRNPEVESKDRIKAVDTLNKMTGEYITKVEHSGEIETKVSKLDQILVQLKE